VVSSENISDEITIRLGPTTFTRLRKFPKEDPLRVWIDTSTSRLHFGSLSLPGQLSPAADVADLDISDNRDPFEVLSVFGRHDAAALERAGMTRVVEAANTVLDRRVAAAAVRMKSLGVSEDAIHRLCVRRIREGKRTFSPAEKRLLDRIAKAWMEVAILGVTPDDLKTLVNDAVRNAWKKSNSTI